MKLTIDECFELTGDYQNQFLGIEVFPEPVYNKLKLSERSVNKVHYKNIYILEPQHYYYITFVEDFDNRKKYFFNFNSFFKNGLILQFDIEQKKIFIFNASQNIVYIQKGVQIGEVKFYG